jgi:phage repressor protein C with HTH and peptisase S24 domain
MKEFENYVEIRNDEESLKFFRKDHRGNVLVVFDNEEFNKSIEISSEQFRSIGSFVLSHKRVNNL